VLKGWSEDARSPDPAVRKAAIAKLENATFDNAGSRNIRDLAKDFYAQALTSHPDEAAPEQPKGHAPSYGNFSLPAQPTFRGK
jgi:hypothetical protein